MPLGKAGYRPQRSRPAPLRQLSKRVSMLYRQHHMRTGAISNQWFERMTRQLTAEVEGSLLGQIA